MNSKAKIAVVGSVVVLGGLFWFLQGEAAAPPVAPSAPSDAGSQAVSKTSAEAPAERKATAPLRETIAKAVLDDSAFQHGFTYNLDVEVIDRTGLPVANAKVLLAPNGCRLCEVPQRTDDNGKLHVEWRGRADSMPMVLATTSDEQDGSMRQFVATAGSAMRMVLGGRRGGGPGLVFRVADGGGGSGGIAFSGITIDPSSAKQLGQQLTAQLTQFVLQQTAFGDNPEFRAGLHPFASFGDVQLRVPPQQADSGGTVQLDGSSFNVTLGDLSVEGGQAASGRPAATAQAARITGVVYGEDGKPAPRVPICWGTEVDRPKKRAETNAQGQFAFENVPEGVIELRAGGALAGLQHATVTTTKGQTAQVTINLKREISVHGKVTTLDGSTLAGCRIEWVGSQNPWTDSATSQQDGVFWLTNLPGGPGRLLLWSSEDAAKLPVAWLDVLPGPDEVVLKFDPESQNGRIVLEPILPEGIDRGSVEVRIFQEDTGRGATLTKLEKSNQFAIQQLPQGWYRLELGGLGLGWIDAGRHFVDGKSTADLGRLALLNPGKAMLQFAPELVRPAAEGQPGSIVELYRRRPDADVRLEQLDLRMLADPIVLAPGDYVAMWKLTTGEQGFVPFAVAAGAEVKVPCALGKGK